MKLKTKTSNDRELEDLLNSDDELPCDYDETPYVPAYKNDDRFKTVQFHWKNIIRENEECQLHESNSNNNVPKIEETQFCNDKVLKKGILHKNDIFFSKCIETSDDTTLLWFVNFLLQKDLQSNYMFLTSCLVPKIQYDSYDTSSVRRVSKEKQRYKIVVQM